MRRSPAIFLAGVLAATTLPALTPLPGSPAHAASGGFTALTRPARLVDTRVGATTVDGQQQGQSLRPAGSVTQVQVGGRAGLGAAPPVVVLNVTATGSQAGGYLTVWPCGTPQPNASNLNFAAGQTIANQVIARVGSQGRVCVFTSAATELIVDAAGTFAGDDAPTMLPTPARLLDTRASALPQPGSTVRVAVRGRAGLAADAQVALLNVTVTDARAAGYVTVWPCTGTAPNASNLNYAAGDTLANAVTARIGASGDVCLFTSSAAHLLVDVAGASSSTTALRMLSTPARVLDTRSGGGTIDGRRAGAGVVGGSGAVALEVAGRAGVPADAGAVLLNVTATGPRGAGYVTVHACGTAQPNASNLNFAAGQTIAGSVVARVGVDGRVRLFTSEVTHLLVDVAGWIDRSPGEAAPTATVACQDADGVAPGMETVSVKVTRREAGVVWFEVTDTSGRNLAATAQSPAPTLAQRTMYVKALYNPGANGLPDPQASAELQLTGHYRSGAEPSGCDGFTGVRVCIGFPLQDPDVLSSQIGWRDIPNHAVDISQVLNVVLADPTLVGGVDRTKIWYSGGSMGGISGLYLVHPQSREPRIRAVAAGVGFAPPWVPEFSNPANWNTGPKVLMQNTMTDQVIPYELARLTVQNAASSNVTLVTYFDGGHQTPPCEAANRYFDQWVQHAVRGGPAPDAGVFTGSNCAALGLQPGGSTGWGSAEGFRPR